MILTQSSIAKLQTVHPDLRRVVIHLANTTSIWFVVTEGVRTLERQKELFLAKKSKTMNSRHLASPLDGLSRAVDLAVWDDRNADRVVGVDELSWSFPRYEALAKELKSVAKRLEVPIVWGGDWKTFKDGPHFELSREKYP